MLAAILQRRAPRARGQPVLLQDPAGGRAKRAQRTVGTVDVAGKSSQLDAAAQCFLNEFCSLRTAVCSSELQQQQKQQQQQQQSSASSGRSSCRPRAADDLFGSMHVSFTSLSVAPEGDESAKAAVAAHPSHPQTLHHGQTQLEKPLPPQRH